jgi:alpha-L-fucosidase
MLVDIVSKNGNLMLNIPLRGNGAPDADELAFLAGMEKWITVNGEGIYGTRPWVTFGEGPSVSGSQAAGQFGGVSDVRPYGSDDVRYMTKRDSLYAFVMAWPDSGHATLRKLSTRSPELAGRRVADVSLLGYPGKINWSQAEDGLRVELPSIPPSEHATALKITGVT